MFQIVTLTGGTPFPILDADGKPLVFEDGKSAATHARLLTKERGEKCQPRPIEDNGWREREAARFASGHYKPLPWAEEDWWKGSAPDKDHYAHPSVDEPGMIAFTESALKGAADRQTRMKVGRYLQQYFGGVLTSDQIRDIGTNYAKLYEDNVLMFAETADEIEEVYTSGPTSCMSHPASHYAGHMHPVRVYAAGDLQLSYIKRDGRITGRALVWPAKKVHGRIYGDEHRMEGLLAMAGYSEGRFIGAKILKVEDEDRSGRYIMPYLDWHQAVNDRGDHFAIADFGDHDCDSTSGVINAVQMGYCEFYDREVPADELHTAYRLGWTGRRVEISVCEEAADDHFIWCEDDDELWLVNDTVVMHDGTRRSPIWFRDYGFTCPVTEENYDKEDGEEGPNGKLYAPGYAPEEIEEEAEEPSTVQEVMVRVSPAYGGWPAGMVGRVVDEDHGTALVDFGLQALRRGHGEREAFWYIEHGSLTRVPPNAPAQAA